MSYVDYTVTGDPARAHATATEALEGRKFTLTWSDPWTVVAERGSKVGNVLAEAMAQHFKIGVRVMSAPTDRQSIVRVGPQSSGWAARSARTARRRTSPVCATSCAPPSSPPASW